MGSLGKCHCVDDVRRLARQALPAPLFHFMDGGAETETSLKENESAFDKYKLMPHYLRDVSEVDTSARILGVETSMPVMLSPTGMSRLFHHGKELAVAQAASRAGIIYSLSTMANSTIEQVAAAGRGAKMFQIYLLRDRELTRDFIARCKAEGFAAMSLTVDTPVGGKRERDLRFGLTMPPRLSLRAIAEFAARPSWTLRYLGDPCLDIANLSHLPHLGRGPIGPSGYVAGQIDRTANWDDLAWLVEEWGGPFAIKGILSPGDASRAVDAGVSAIMISNHGGRQLDHTPAPIDCVAPIRDVVGSKVELIVDGGIRRGTQVLKALALGANACSIGRPYLYGLAAGGEAGVAHVLDILRLEIETSMVLLGRSNLHGMSREDLF